MSPAAASQNKSSVWAPNIFAGKVVLCTGGAGSICSVQVAALVELGANAVIIGRRAANTSARAAEIALLRPGARVLGLAADVRDAAAMAGAVATTLAEFGRLDFVM